MIKSFHPSSTLEVFTADPSTPIDIPIIGTISAGFPSPADDFIETSIDLNKALIKNRVATYFMRVVGSSMKGAGIDDGDLLIIDRSIIPKNNKIAVCYLDGEFTVKRLRIEKDVVWLIAENSLYKPIKATKDNDFEVWGIVTNVIKTL